MYTNQLKMASLRRSCLSVVAAMTLWVGVAAPPAAAQGMDEISRFMNDGGAWLSLDIEGGRGSFTGVRVPTMGMRFEGWFQVAEVHSGEWTIRVIDLQGPPDAGPVVDVTVKPGEQLPIAHSAGVMAQVQVDVQWSEPRDTILWVWVGLPDREASPVPVGP
jgi:hypothetical protein